ncbi:MAG: STAS domain-containing protein [Deltaproteobacteria bacterium]|nr:STAS domain-containing protein [Deltaproteobacteria bacterium]
MDIYRDDNNNIVIKGSLTVTEIETTYSRLEGLLEQLANNIVVDLSGVEEIDTTGLQLLLSLKKTAEESGSFCMKNLSKPVKEALQLSALEHVLEENIA